MASFRRVAAGVEWCGVAARVLEASLNSVSLVIVMLNVNSGHYVFNLLRRMNMERA